MDNEKLGGREVQGPTLFTFSIKGKGEERADELIKNIEASPLTGLIQEYLRAAEEVRKNKKLTPEDKLKKLLPPFNEIQKIIFENYLQYHQFVDDTYINLEKELDLENLRPDPQKYSLIVGIEDQKLRHLSTNHKNIWLSEEYEWYLAYCKDVNPISEAEFKRKCERGEINITDLEVIHKPSKWDSIADEIISPSSGNKSISDIWQIWLPTLNQASIKSRDLLTQILVCYTIKRALNGDEAAGKKLYTIYERAAEGLAINAANKLKLYSMQKEMKQDVKIWLEIIIKGFRPEFILNQLLKSEKEGLIVALPKWVKKFFIFYFSEYIPQRIEKILEASNKIDKLIGFGNALASGQISTTGWSEKHKELREAIDNLQKMNLQEGTDWLTKRKEVLSFELFCLFNLYATIHQGTFFKASPVRIHRFNNYSYLPTKMGPRRNLTIWLFGKSPVDPRSNLYRLLRDKYRPLMRERFKTIHSDFNDGFDQEGQASIGSKDRTKAIRAKEILPNRSSKEIIDELIQLGAPPRDAEMFTKWRFKKTFPGEQITQQKLAKEYHLSERWVRKICRKVEKLISSE